MPDQRFYLVTRKLKWLANITFSSPRNKWMTTIFSPFIIMMARTAAKTSRKDRGR